MDDRLLSEALRALNESTECARALQKEMADALRALKNRPTETIHLREQVADAKVKTFIEAHHRDCQTKVEKARADALERFTDRKIAPLARDLVELTDKIQELTLRIDMTSKTLLDGEKTRETMGTIGEHVAENRRRIFGWIDKETGDRSPGLIDRIEDLESWLEEEEERRRELVAEGHQRVKTFRFWFEVGLKVLAILLPLGLSIVALLSARGAI